MCRNFFYFVVLLNTLASAALLDVPNSNSKVSYDWTSALEQVWQGILERNRDPWSTGLIHRPKSEYPGDAVSEGQGYGMMVALYSGDQENFDSIWQASETYMWNGASLNWQMDSLGHLLGSGAATDADQDVAAMLIFADSLVGAGIWDSSSLSSGVTYGERAQAMLNQIWSYMTMRYITGSDTQYHLMPGDGWGSYYCINPGYYTPAYYRIFADFDTNSTHYWLQLLDQGYTTLESNPGAALGIGPDWSDGTGAVLSDGPGYNAFDDGHSMYKDGIRILWRTAIDAIWFGEDRAVDFLTKSMNFLDSLGGASAANFYQLDGSLVCDTCHFVFDGGDLMRPRQEHSHLTIGMWATAAMAAGTDSQREALSEEMQKFYAEGNNFFGLATDDNDEDTLHNEMYFDQFLAWFGTALMAGVYGNVLYDIANPPPVALQSSTKTSTGKLLVSARKGSVSFRWQGTSAGNVTLRIMDLHGREVQRVSMEKGSGLWSQAPSGMYVAQLQNGSMSETRRFMVTR
ncbi:MAG TPA: glycosyl hydrolase family 8 [Fibrobacteraceae bacterium]|nr:glycosyl hydrolase family 8 [Fibrobacteraceae bacterium]